MKIFMFTLALVLGSTAYAGGGGPQQPFAQTEVVVSCLDLNFPAHLNPNKLSLYSSLNQTSALVKLFAPLAAGGEGFSNSVQNLGANRFMISTLSSSGKTTVSLAFNSAAKTVRVAVDLNGVEQVYNLSCQAVVYPKNTFDMLPMDMQQALNQM